MRKMICCVTAYLFLAGCGQLTSEPNATSSVNDEWVPLCTRDAENVKPSIFNDPLATQLKEDLANGGATVRIHGASHRYSSYVMRFAPKQFFDNLQLPMVGISKEAREQLKTVKRHDLVRIQGRMVERAPVPHVFVTALEITEAYSDTFQPDSSPKFPEIDPSEIINAKVHTPLGDRNAFVAEIEGHIVPVIFPESMIPKTKDLYRNDKIQLRLETRGSPSRPTHFEITEDQMDDFKVLESMVNCHGIETELVGYLSRFQKSPLINRDIFALKRTDSRGELRNWTLVNFEDFDLLDALQNKAKDMWFANDADVENSRNHQVNQSIKVRAKGMLNVVSPYQANPQIFIYDLNDLELTLEK